MIVNREAILGQGKLDECQFLNTGTPPAGVITIPVVFHLVIHPDSADVYNKSVNSNRSFFEELVNSQLESLNEAFNGGLDNGMITSDPMDKALLDGISANAEIRFQLATQGPENLPTSGIEYKEVRRQFIATKRVNNIFLQDFFYDKSNLLEVIEIKKGGLDHWDPKRYLNIWICFISSQNGPFVNAPGELIGVAQYPWVTDTWDGVIVSARPWYLGMDKTNLIHEVGHYLGLLHPWEKSCDDCISDTPKQKKPSGRKTKGSSDCYDFPYFPDGKTTICSAPLDPQFGQLFMNFMDYSPQACQTLFTKEQVLRMRRCFLTNSGLRQELISSSNYALEPCNANHIYEPNNSLINLTITGPWDDIGKNGAKIISRSWGNAVGNCDPVDFYPIHLDHNGSLKIAIIDPGNDLRVSLLNGAGQTIEHTGIASFIPTLKGKVLTICRNDSSTPLSLPAFLKVSSKDAEIHNYFISLRWEPNAPCRNGTPVINPGGSPTAISAIPSKTKTCAKLPEKITLTLSGGSGQYLVYKQDGSELCQGNCGGGTLTFWSPQLSGEYVYWVFDKDQYLTISPLSFTLTVVDPPDLDDIPILAAPNQGGVSFTMHASGGTPPYSYQWLPPFNYTYSIFAPVTGGSLTDTAITFSLSGAAWLDPLEVVAHVTDANGCRVSEYTGYNQRPNNGGFFTVSGYTQSENNPILLSPSGNWAFIPPSTGPNIQITNQGNGTATAVSELWIFENSRCHLGRLIGGNSLRLCWVAAPVDGEIKNISVVPGEGFYIDAPSRFGKTYPGVKYVYEWTPKEGVVDPYAFQTTIIPPDTSFDKYILTVVDSLGGTNTYTVDINFVSPDPNSNLQFGPGTRYYGRFLQDDFYTIRDLPNGTEGFLNGSILYIESEVVNMGTSRTDSVTKMVVELMSEDTVIRVLTGTIPNGLPVGSSTTFFDSLDVSEFPIGVYALQGLVDLYDEESQQIDIDDIWLADSTVLYIYPDAIAEDLQVDKDTVLSGSLVNLSGYTSNAGPRNLDGTFAVNIWVSLDEEIDSNDSLIQTFSVSGPLAFSDRKSFSAQWTVPPSPQDSLFFFIVEIDETNKVEELNELNQFTIPFWVGEKRSTGLSGFPQAARQKLTNFPNPFSEVTEIEFDLPSACDVKLSVYTVSGGLIEIQNVFFNSGGKHAILFDGRGLASGMYLFQVDTPEASFHGKMLIQR